MPPVLSFPLYSSPLVNSMLALFTCDDNIYKLLCNHNKVSCVLFTGWCYGLKTNKLNKVLLGPGDNRMVELYFPLSRYDAPISVSNINCLNSCCISVCFFLQLLFSRKISLLLLKSDPPSFVLLEPFSQNKLFLKCSNATLFPCLDRALLFQNACPSPLLSLKL